MGTSDQLSPVSVFEWLGSQVSTHYQWLISSPEVGDNS